MSTEGREVQPKIELSAVCGLFCPSCTLYIGSTEEPERLRALAERFGAPVGAMECHGCRSAKRGLYCEKVCTMRGCAEQKGVSFCGECPEYPCEELKAFKGQMPHRAELWESLDQIGREGYEAWYTAMAQRYSCLECGALNSAYDVTCRRCGSSPSCDYAASHRDEVASFLGRMGPAD
jgi:hypothetical protein